MLSYYRAGAWTAILVACLAHAAHADVTPAAKELLAKCLETQTRLNVQISRSEILSDAVKDGKRSIGAQLVEMRRDKNRYDQIRWDWNSLPSLDIPRRVEDASAMRQMFDGTKLFDGWIFRGTNIYDIWHKDVTVAMKEPPEKATRNTTLAQYPAAPLDGYVVLTPWPQNGRTVETVQSMDNVSLRPETEVINGAACHVIDASSGRQRFRLWIDPEHGYHIAKAEYEESGARKLLSSSFGDVRFEKHGDLWVPVQGTVRMRWTKDNKLVSEGTIQIKRTSIDLHPDFAAVGAFVADLPNGTNINVYEAPGIKHVWQNGQIVPYVDATAVSAIDTTVAELSRNGGVQSLSLPGVTQVSTSPAIATPIPSSANGDNAAQAVHHTAWVWWGLAGVAALVLTTTQWLRQRHVASSSLAAAERSVL
ncbi:MAG: hypothetical protein ACM359_06480 [Bacillota bacterium]